MKYIIASLIVLLLGFFGMLNPLRNFVVSLFVPVQFGLAKSAMSINDGISFFAHANKIRQENLLLLQQLHDKDLEIVSLKIKADENTLLRQQLNLAQNSGTNYKSILVNVIGNNEELSDATLLLDRGSKDDIHVGDMAVIGKYLVGTIKSVGYSRSVLELITSPNLSFTAYDLDSKDKAKGLVVGRHSAVLNFERILPTEQISKGDTVVTLGKEGIFLPNFVVGKIDEVANDPSQPLKNAVIKVEIDFSKLTEVFILQSPKE